MKQFYNILLESEILNEVVDLDYSKLKENDFEKFSELLYEISHYIKKGDVKNPERMKQRYLWYSRKFPEITQFQNVYRLLFLFDKDWIKLLETGKIKATIDRPVMSGTNRKDKRFFQKLFNQLVEYAAGESIDTRDSQFRISIGALIKFKKVKGIYIPLIALMLKRDKDKIIKAFNSVKKAKNKDISLSNIEFTIETILKKLEDFTAEKEILMFKNNVDLKKSQIENLTMKAAIYDNSQLEFLQFNKKVQKELLQLLKENLNNPVDKEKFIEFKNKWKI